MSRTTLAAICFVLGLLSGVGLSLYLKPVGAETSATLDLRLRSGETYRVRRVIDGDTVVLENGMHLRYSGVNTPESGRFVKDPAPKAAEATARNRELVEGKEVRVELAAEPLDLHGRALGRVFIKEGPAGGAEQNVSEILVREGLARAMPMGSNDDGARLKEAQAKAQAERVGIWDAAAAPSGAAFIASSSSRLYHTAECSIARRIKPEAARRYVSRAEAEAAGLTACETCSNKTGTQEPE